MPRLEKRERLKLPHVPVPRRPPQDRITDFREVGLTYTPEQAAAEAARCLECGKAPCEAACPLHNRIRGWLALAMDGRFVEAAHLSRSTNPMPEICGRICPQDRLCEGACTIGVKREPVAIGAIEKFINEYAIAREGLPLPDVAPATGLRVGVVGAGPAGLACAQELACRGHHVTVYERQPLPGGLLRYGIPGFKLEKHVVDRRIRYLERLGVQFVTGTRVGDDIALEEMRTYFHAVYIASGATTPKRPALPGSDLPGVEDALPFLARNAMDDLDPADRDDLRGQRVVVLGGGDTAMDCLRVARRLGAAEVVCLYRRDEANMPGSRREVQAARDEGVVFRWLSAPVRFLADGGRLRGIECVRMELGEPDEEGRRRPVPVEGSTFQVPADLAILAFGFDGSPLPAADGPALRGDGTYVVDEDGATTVPGVFAGGDAVRGPDLVATALRDGRRAAAAIDRYLHRRLTHPRDAAPV
ncbi:MAG: NAD(P)-dependent oxidoreductase [Armatimonadota bacterium]|nr:NAD(P)-dependent oxidoreductase [Armatimonadota bacterium]MDR7427890.1 NAD(P)-dependent oxidoreductase [Armatimonadota bacterium]MDR7463893.1 NAD(P)-dependent oxidoreductase [Armatimonadota bacterium]MDR7470063.1 NAD(P)-dependent oxidoreductase [Armatimonadota bacterium]MDR7474415.1 NAD(P)-dependent oxidoreductase [Armatimonadota bacterium]